MKRRDVLLQTAVISVTTEKKEEDMFDLKYLPEEYLSDIQEDSDDNE